MKSDKKVNSSGFGMLIRIESLPIEGRLFEFPLDLDSLNKRTNLKDLVRPLSSKKTNQKVKNSLSSNPTNSLTDSLLDFDKIDFLPPVTASIYLTPETSAVVAKGSISAELKAYCSRCLKEVNWKMTPQVYFIIKPKGRQMGTIEELSDIGLFYYKEEDFDLASALEEILILEIPTVISCISIGLGECSINKEISRYLVEDRESKESILREELQKIRLK